MNADKMQKYKNGNRIPKFRVQNQKSPDYLDFGFRLDYPEYRTCEEKYLYSPV